MALFIADCPRCRSTKMTFDVHHLTFDTQITTYGASPELFGTCRHCHKGASFVFDLRRDSEDHFKALIRRVPLQQITVTLNPSIVGYRPVALSDVVIGEPPEHLPAEILNAFVEGQKTLAIGCFNASGAMSRLTLDLATKQLLARYEGLPDVTRRIKENLSERLMFLIGNGTIPKSLEDLAHHVRLEGNDAAHDGVLKENEARDLIEFCQELLRACFEQPGKVLEAKRRRDERRQG